MARGAGERSSTRRTDRQAVQEDRGRASRMHEPALRVGRQGLQRFAVPAGARVTVDICADRRSPANIVFAASAKSALGQLQRVTNVAAAVHGRPRGLALELVTTSQQGAEWARRTPVYRNVTVLDTRAMAERMSSMEPGAVVVGSMAVPGLEKVDAPLCLILREVIPSELERFRLGAGRP